MFEQATFKTGSIYSMIFHFLISLLLLLLFIGCKTSPNKNEISFHKTEIPTSYEKSNQVAKNKSAIDEVTNSVPLEEETIKYEVNDDYLTDEEYPVRFESEGVNSIVFHYTAQNYKKSVRSLTTGGNSSHWLVPEKGGAIYKIVSEDRRARHAGSSLWKNRKNLNVVSVGVEIVNLGFKCKDHRKYCPKNALDWIVYPETQQKLIIALAKDIQKRYDIDPLCVIGHSDIATDRKLDPGPLFPWKRLAENGVGAWVYDDEIEKQVELIKNSIPGNISKLLVQIRLHEFGYDIKKDGSSNKTVESKIMKYEYNMRKTPIADLSELNKANEFGNKKPENNIFDEKKTNFAIQSFLMHYLPRVYIDGENNDQFTDHYSKHDTEHVPDHESDNNEENNAEYKVENIEILATLQALLIKYPHKARMGCSF